MSIQEQLNRAFHLFEEKEFDASIKIYGELLQNGLSVKDEITLRYAYGYPLSEMGCVEEAIDNYSRLKELGEQENNLEIISQAIHQQGMVYRQAAQFEKALEHFLAEREMIHSHFKENKLFQSANNYELGYTHLLMGNYPEASNYLEKSLIEAKVSQDPMMIACAYRGLGEYHAGLLNKEKALNCFEESIRYFEIASDEIGAAEVEKLIKKIK